ncbi:hypothetical protein I4U23_015314 [Adineta vaga]|nr:hypothetical protein I4U23_015314 [Adineta vaga]
MHVTQSSSFANGLRIGIICIVSHLDDFWCTRISCIIAHQNDRAYSDFEIFILGLFCILVLLILPQLSNNCLLMACIQELLLSSDLDSLISFGYMPFIKYVGYSIDIDQTRISHQITFAVICTVLFAIVSLTFMFLTVLLSYRNNRRRRQKAKTTSEEISNGLHKRFIMTMAIQVLATALCCLVWTVVCILIIMK